MAAVNLLRHYPRSKRRLSKPRSLDPANSEVAQRFGREYFDGTREQGYGGYRYDGRWVPIARDIVDHFGLRAGHRVLDVGCAKGFLLKDLLGVCPGLQVYGLDVSEYAVGHCEAEVGGRLVVGTADRLPFPDKHFDLVLSINTLHNLERSALSQALREIERLAPGRSYVQVDAYRTEAERDIFLGWVLTAMTFLQPPEWEKIFSDAGFTGDYYWTILDADPNWNDFAADDAAEHGSDATRQGSI
jgi:SAM-dependent methyltransferase